MPVFAAGGQADVCIEGDCEVPSGGETGRGGRTGMREPDRAATAAAAEAEPEAGRRGARTGGARREAAEEPRAGASARLVNTWNG